VLINEHSQADSVDVESVKKVLDALLNVATGFQRIIDLLHLKDALGHRLDHGRVTVEYRSQRCFETIE